MSPAASLARAGGVVLARATATAVVVSAAVFAAVSALPSDAADTRTGGRASAEALAQLRETLGLDAPLWQRWGRWTTTILNGDWGRSLVTDRPVADLVAPRLQATAVLTAVAVALAVPLMLALALGVGTTRPSSARRWAAFATAGAALPQTVVVAVLVVVLSGLLGWLPPLSLLPPGGSPADRPDLLVLPALALALPAAAWAGGLLGGAVADSWSAPHVRDAVARGVTGWRLRTRHVLPFVLSPAIRAVAVVTAGTATSAAVVETMLGYQGLGELLVTAVAGRDTPVVAAVGLIGALVVVAGTALADMAAAAVEVRRDHR